MSGERMAAANSRMLTVQPPTPRLSTIILSMATPSSAPAPVALIATVIHELSRGDHGLRRRVSSATPNTRMDNTMPAAAVALALGKFEIGSPAGYFNARSPSA